MNKYYPDAWSLIKTPTTYKIFGSWRGSYLESSSWKLNSGITDVKEDEDNYYFEGHSGSIYECSKKERDDHNGFGSDVLKNILRVGGVELVDAPIEDVFPFYKGVKNDN